ncbi:MAG TPA: hypothetical protein VET25_03520 [Aestuariivirgaceae bacterium]|nr:hypothetical protein [Aestuariivirgaceae bacterium]
MGDLTSNIGDRDEVGAKADVALPFGFRIEVDHGQSIPGRNRE